MNWVSIGTKQVQCLNFKYKGQLSECWHMSVKGRTSSCFVYRVFYLPVIGPGPASLCRLLITRLSDRVCLSLNYLDIVMLGIFSS